MADFCKQCSIETFGKDFGDHADRANARRVADAAKEMYPVVICEGCGPVQVDPDGACVSEDCIEKHGAPAAPPKPMKKRKRT